MIFRFRRPKGVSADDPPVPPEVVVAILFVVGVLVGVALNCLIGG